MGVAEVEVARPTDSANAVANPRRIRKREIMVAYGLVDGTPGVLYREMAKVADARFPRKEGPKSHSVTAE